MGIFINKNTRNLILAIISILILLLIGGQLLALVVSVASKQMLITHDYEIAGYLEKEQVDSDIITKAFTSHKDSSLKESGRALLTPAGYREDLKEGLLTGVQQLHRQLSLSLLLLTILIAALLLVFLLTYFIRLERKLNQASADIREFLDGNTELRLEHYEEGSLSKLFNSVNGLATSLNTHIVKEKQNKEFLKNTISDISHQLKTPLAALRMYNEIIQEDPGDQVVVTDFLHKTDRELNRMEVLIQNLLKLAKLNSDSILLNCKSHQLKDLLQDITDYFGTRARNEEKKLILTCDDSMTLNYDEEWLYEAISNLVKNALDHTKPGDLIELLCLETPVLKEIRVKDTGSGIHPEDLHHIFKRFYRSRYSQDTRGTGIGLTLAKMIIEKHGASIMVESELGKGTTFGLIFPKLTNL